MARLQLLPTALSEERESSSETLAVPEVVGRRAARETSGPDRPHQGGQAQQRRRRRQPPGDDHRGPLQVRQTLSDVQPLSEQCDATLHSPR